MRAAVALAAALAVTSANAEFWTGNQLLAAMAGDHGERMMAIGYVIGAHDALDGIIACTPSSVTSGQVRDMVRRDLELAPETRHKSANLLIAATLQRTWPCRRTNGGEL